MSFRLVDFLSVMVMFPFSAMGASSNLPFIGMKCILLITAGHTSLDVPSLMPDIV